MKVQLILITIVSLAICRIDAYLYFQQSSPRQAAQFDKSSSLYIDRSKPDLIIQQNTDDLLFSTVAPISMTTTSTTTTNANTLRPQFETIDEQQQQQVEIEQEIDLLNQTISSETLANVTHLELQDDDAKRQSVLSTFNRFKNDSNLLEKYVEMVRNERNHSQSDEFEPNEKQSIEQFYESNELPLTKSNRIKAAIFTSYKLSDNSIPNTEEYLIEEQSGGSLPPIIEVIPNGSRPLEIHFKSATKRIRIVQELFPSEQMNNNETVVMKSDEEPQKFYHQIKKPIIQEVREIIIPYRKVIQEIQPVQENVHTIVHSPSQKHSKIGDNNKFSKKLTLLNESSSSSPMNVQQENDSNSLQYSIQMVNKVDPIGAQQLQQQRQQNHQNKFNIGLRPQLMKRMFRTNYDIRQLNY